MKKAVITFSIILVILGLNFYFLRTVHAEWQDCSSFSSRATAVFISYQDLATDINKITAPDTLVRAKDSPDSLFPDRVALLNHVTILRSIVRDSVNTKIAGQLYAKISSSFPGTIQEHKAEIYTLIQAGTSRTKFLLEYSNTKTSQLFIKLITWTFIFILLTIATILYTTVFFLKRTQQKEKKDLLINKEAQFRMTLDNLMEGVQIHDFEWRYTYVNDSLATFSNYSKEELIGKTIMEKFPGIESTEVFKVLERCMKERRSDHMETEFVFPDGSKGTFELSIQPVPEGIFVLSVDITARKEAEKKLKQNIKEFSEYKFALDQSSIVAITDQKGIIKHVNQNFCRISKYEESELLGKDHRIVSSGYHPKTYIRDLWTTISRGKIWHGELKNKAKDGTYYWVDTTIIPLLNDQGKPYEYLAIRSDITERKKAEEKFHKVNRLYTFLSAINQTIVHSTSQSRLLDEVCRIATEIGQFKLAYIGMLDEQNKLNINNLSGDSIGLDLLSQITGLDVNDPVLKDTPTVKAIKNEQYDYNNDMQNDPTLIRWRESLIKRGVSSSISVPIKIFEKTVGVLGLHAGPRNFFDKEEIGLLAEAAGDISFALENFEKAKKHRETEELVLKNERKFRSLIEKSADMKTLTNKEGFLTYVSPSVLKSFGYTMEEILYKQASRFFHPEDVPKLASNKDKFLNKPGESYHFEFRLLHKNGNWIWCEGTVSNFLDEPGIEALVSNFMDITESKKNALEKEVFINQLTQNNHDLRQFAYITSHNLRGPIANLMGLTNLLDNYQMKDETLIKIFSGIKQAASMFDETIKDLSTVLTVKDDPNAQLEKIEFTEVFEKVTVLCETLLKESNAEISSDFTNAPQVDFSRPYLESIFVNLVTNSIKYRDARRPLKINAHTVQEKDHIVLTFTDNGTGFDSGLYKEKIFKLYQRFHTHKEGKGLGLFLIKSQLEALRGSIDVISSPDNGARFIIRFKKTGGTLSSH